MMSSKNAIIVHGKPSREKFESPDYPGPHKANWLPRIGEQLKSRGFEVAIPQLPVPYAPVYGDGARVLEREKIGEETTLVGHSYGAGLLLRWMSEHRKVTVDKLVFVAPWLDPNHKYGDLSDFEIDPQLADRCLGGLAVFYSSLDSSDVQTSVERIRDEVPGAVFWDIPEYGHFLLGNTMTSVEFPELLEEIV